LLASHAIRRFATLASLLALFLSPDCFASCEATEAMKQAYGLRSSKAKKQKHGIFRRSLNKRSKKKASRDASFCFFATHFLLRKKKPSAIKTKQKNKSNELLCFIASLRLAAQAMGYASLPCLLHIGLRYTFGVLCRLAFCFASHAQQG
jgi:hypothetical protein